MGDLLKRIANYFANEYDGDDKTAPKMELSVDELRYITSMHVEKCRTESELRELKNKRYSRTNADRIRSFSDEELAELLDSVDNGGIRALDIDYPCDECTQKTKCDECFLEWLQSEVEE